MLLGNRIATVNSGLFRSVEENMISQRKSQYLLAVMLAGMGCLDTANAQSGQLTANPSQVIFNVQPGDVSVPEIVQLSTSNSQPVSFSLQATTQTGGPWLVVSPPSGNTPAQLFVSASASGLAAGSYTGAIVVTSSGVTNSPFSIPVTLNVGSQITATPSTLSFTYQTGAANPAAQTLAINSSGTSPISFTVSTPVTSGGSWLLATPTTGTTPASLSISVNPSGLTAGIYDGKVRITAVTQGAGTLEVPVTLTVSSNPTLKVSPSGGLSFAYQTGTSSPAAQTLTFSTDTGSVAFTLVPSTDSGGSWLVLNSFSGVASQSQSQPITASVNITGLLPGAYTGRVLVSAPGASNPSFQIPVSLLVSSNPLLILGTPPATFNYQIGGTIPAAQSVPVTSSSTPITFTVAATTSSGSNWLVAGPATGTTPQPVTISVNPAGLAPGNYDGTVTISSAGAGNSPVSIPVKLTVGTSTMLNADTGGLTFNYQTTTQQVPAAQLVHITSTGAPLNYSAAVTASSCGGSWLSVSPTTGTTPGQFTVSVAPAGISAPSTCSGTVAVTAQGASNSLSIPVTLNVSASPLLNIAPASLSFTAPVGTSSPLTPKVISLTSTDTSTPIPFTVTASTASGATWLFIASSGGNNTPANISVIANPAGLPVGTYQGTVTITSANLPAAQNIPVTLTITSNVTVSASPSSVSLNAPANATAAVTAQVQLQVTGTTSPVAFTASASVQQGSGWLSVTPAGGSAPQTLQISAQASGLSQGTYNGQITVIIPGASNSPINIPVTLTVGPAQTLTVNNTQLSFSYVLGSGIAPANQTVTVASTGGPVTFTATASTTSCGNFLSVSPTSATTTAIITAGVNVANVSQGTCNGTITIAAQGIQSQIVNVVLTVTAPVIPAITAVVNAASYAPGPVAPGEIVTIYGVNIGPATLTTYVLNPNNTFATKVADTEVLFDNIPAPIVYVRGDQSSVVVPFEIAGRPTVTIQVRRQGQTSASLQVRVVDQAPGIFTINVQGYGQGAIVNLDGTVNGPDRPAPKGSVVAVFLTGAGLMATNPQTGTVLSANPLPILNASTTAFIGGQTASVAYSGGAPLAIAGLYQINLTVPATLPGSGPQPVTLLIGSTPAQGNVTVYVQ
jgi:uncharacterized protein (TIGR03437 family)